LDRKLLENIHAVTNEAVLIDTRVSVPTDIKTQPFIEKGDWKFDGIHSNNQPAMAAHPTLSLIKNFFVAREYEVEQIKASFPVYKEMSQNDNYDIGKRITLFCKRQ